MEKNGPPVKSAVILAAGMGTRLRDVLDDRPKGLLKIGDREIIRRSLDAILRHGLEEIILVTGYRQEEYHRALSRDYPMIRFVENKDFAVTGSMHSFFLASEVISTDFLLLESDLLYEDRCLSTLLGCAAEDVILLSCTTHSVDEVYVYGADHRIQRISKNRLPGLTCQGELVGISRISRSLCWKMREYYQHQSAVSRTCHYEDCLSDLASTTAIPYHQVEDLVWTEIDDPSHYQRALTVIYPKILAGERKMS